MMHRHEFRAMGCRMLALIESVERPAVLDSLPEQFEAWEQALSRFRSDSELCELNRRAGETASVSDVILDVFNAARQAEFLTDGLVNPLISEALIHAGYDRSFDAMLAGDFLLDQALSMSRVPALSDVSVDREAHTMKLPIGTKLDFGGIAKGWAAEQAMVALSAHGPALFSAGGDIAVSGPLENGQPWNISVENPFDWDSYIEMLYVDSGGVATSSRAYRSWVRGGTPQHHIIDPRTGLPAETDVVAATVIAPTGLQAEALAKAVLISGSQAGMARLDGDESLAGLLVLDNGQRLYSRKLQRYL